MEVLFIRHGESVSNQWSKYNIHGNPQKDTSLYHDSPYSISKIVGELYGNFYFQQYGLPIIKARFSNVYGPREVLGAGAWRG